MAHSRLPICILATAVVLVTTFLALLAYNNSHSSFQLPLHASWSKRPPDAVIIGVKKGGTRALLEMLKLHPGVLSPVGEVHFYDRNYERGMDWYLSRLPTPSPGQLIIEKTPSYLVTPGVPAKMATVNPDTRIILVAREPVSRLVSDFVQLSKGEGDFDSFVLSPEGQVLESSRPVRTGLYAQHLRRWTAVFPSEQIHVVNGDRLVLDPAAELLPLQAFLNIEPVVKEDTFFFNDTKGFFCWHSKRQKSCLGEGKGRSHPDISPSTLLKLKEFYSAPNRAFFQLLVSLKKPVPFDWN